MKVKLLVSQIAVVLLVATGCAISTSAEKKYRWAVHDMSRPVPKVVSPAEDPGQPPSDAIILFDGTDLSEWVSAGDGSPAKWKVENGYIEVIPETGDIRTKRAFGNCQLHIEWASSAKVSGNGQDSGNSGVFLMSNYEVQVLNSYDNRTYADGHTAAVYGQQPPLVNACRPPGQWQSYDIIFHRPIFKDSKVVKPATITMLHNGVLVQDHFEIEGGTVWRRRAEYNPHGDKLPIRLQDHDHPVRYRNIWVRELAES